MASQTQEEPNTRGKTWSEEEELAVIDIYFEDEIQRMVEGTARNKAVYRKISQRLEEEYGISRTDKEVQTKINNLKSWYRKQPGSCITASGGRYCEINLR